MSERGRPDGYRFKHGFGCHTLGFLNAARARHWVKGIRNLDNGAMRVDGHAGGTPSIVPNSRQQWLDQPALAVDGAAAHWDHRADPAYGAGFARALRQQALR